jgi:hypothetical protein
LSQPGGSLQFIATLAPDGKAIEDGVYDGDGSDVADFQVTPSGNDAVFTSTKSLTGFPNLEQSEIYRYDAPSQQMACASCPETEASPTSDTNLSSIGRNISDDGRVFFTSAEQLVLRDTNKKKDVYEWENGRIELVSTGGGSTGSGLVTVSGDGRDAFFFTRQVLSRQDHNGSAMKIYDARTEGGFFSDITPPPCQASDECHGPGTEAPAPTQIATLTGAVGNRIEHGATCRRGFVRRHGRCAKKHTGKARKTRSQRGHG